MSKNDPQQHQNPTPSPKGIVPASQKPVALPLSPNTRPANQPAAGDFHGARNTGQEAPGGN